MAKNSSKISVVSIVMVALVAVFLVLGIAGVCVDEYLVGVQEQLDVREPAGSFQDLTDGSKEYQEWKEQAANLGLSFFRLYVLLWLFFRSSSRADFGACSPWSQVLQRSLSQSS